MLTLHYSIHFPCQAKSLDKTRQQSLRIDQAFQFAVGNRHRLRTGDIRCNPIFIECDHQAIGGDIPLLVIIGCRVGPLLEGVGKPDIPPG